ncbi:BTB/POZ domain [Trinorchestia longiramus]|nr:BTB/POZ domain [Trinorchestia longiramus]
MNEDSKVSMITIKCGELTLKVSRAVLIKESGYFRSIMEGSYADSTNIEHTIHPEMVEPKLLQFIVKWLVHGEPADLQGWTMDAIMQKAEACEVLQMENISRKLWEVAASKLTLDNCILDAKRFYTPSSGAADFMKLLWNSIQWKFYEIVWCYKILSQLTEAELYWILRNPSIVEPTGGVLSLILIDAYVRCHFPSFDHSEGAFSFSSEAISMTARLVFALLESIELQVEADPPEDYVPKTKLPRPCDSNCAKYLKNEIRCPEDKNIHTPANPACECSEREEGKTAVPPGFSLPLLYRDIEIINKHRQDKNVFQLMYNTQKKNPWKACFVDQTHFGRPRSMKISTELPTEQMMASDQSGAPLWSYNEETQSFEQELSKLSIPSGARLCVYGHDLLVVGGEQNFIGSNRFCSQVQRYSFMTKEWTSIELFGPLCHRSFNFSWLPSRGLLLQGGYREYRQHNDQLKLLKEKHINRYDGTSDEETEILRYNGGPNYALKKSVEQILRVPKKPHYPFQNSLGTIWSNEVSNKMEEKHTFNFHEFLMLECIELPRVGPNMIAGDQAMIFTSSEHVCLIDRGSLNIYCPFSHDWFGYSLLLPESLKSIGTFTAAFPYGTGVYVVAFDRRVFFVPLSTCPRNDSDRIGETRKRSDLKVRLLLYSSFKSCGSQLCRVRDKLYLSGQQTNDQPLVVEVLPLLYNPLEPDWAQAPQSGSESSPPSCIPHRTFSLSPHPTETVKSAAQVPPHHPGSNFEKPAVLRSKYADQEHEDKPTRDSLACSEGGGARLGGCGSPALVCPHVPAQLLTVIHRSTAATQRVLSDVLPTAASIRRAAATQHRLLDSAMLSCIMKFFGIPPILTPAGNYAELLITEMKNKVYMNWDISIPQFSLTLEGTSFKSDSCMWCNNFESPTNLIDDGQTVPRVCDTYIERPKFTPPLVPLPGCNGFPILKN